MKVNYKLSLICSLAIALIIISSAPFVFGDSNVTLIQNASNGQVNLSSATCVLTSAVAGGDSLMMTLDAAFTDHTTIAISDSLGNTWKPFVEVLNSATTWAQAWEAQNIAHGGASDTITVTYTDSSGRDTYQSSCAEFLGNVNFTQIGGLISGSASCNTCNLNLTSTLVYNGHKINYFTGWSASSANPLTFSYTFLSGFSALSGSGTSQAISGGGGSILAFHAESNVPATVGGDSGVSLTCSPACSQTPVLALTFYANCIANCNTVTSTITGWLFPNFANGVNSFSWFIGFLILLVPLSMVDTVFMSGNLSVDRNVIIFINLAMLFLGALLATMVNQLPFAIPFVFGMFLVVYIWRGRG